MSTNTNINYYNLIDYISPDENFHSHRLSVRVSKIIKLGRSALFDHEINHYSHYVSAYQRANIVRCVKKDLEKSFDFDLFTLLINCNARFNSVTISNLCDFLRRRLEKSEKAKSKNGAVKVFPRDDELPELNQVGYWCFLGVLKKEPFSEFVGKSDEFDFYYLFEHFDFAKFNVSWLFFLKKPAIELISKKPDVKNKIRERVSKALREDNLSAKDELKLSKILYKYFC